MRNITVFILLLNLSPASWCFAQDLKEIKTKFSVYLQNSFQEKIFVHTDRNSYLAGETIWFSIYYAEAYTNLPAKTSSVAYIELINSNKKPIMQSTIALNHGRGNGALYIPADLPSGYYTLRSYTNWMKNFSADFYFHKDIPVYNTLREEAPPATQEKESYAIQFFPEGGNLVTNLSSNIAFKATDQRGKGFNFQAAVINSTNDTIVKFHSLESGLGSFNFRPKSGETYRVWAKSASGTVFSTSLPRVFEKGVVMLAKEDGNSISLSVQSNTPVIKKFVLFVHSGQRIVFLDSLDAADIQKGFHVPVKMLGDGISHFTLFSSDGKALCERLYFKKPENLLHIEVAADKDSYRTREKVQLKIGQMLNNQPVKGNYSVSIYKSGTSSPSNENIETSLWLTSELKGKIDNADWYFNHATSAETDLVMLTHGWRRFKWEDILQQTVPEHVYLPEIEGHIIRGRITNQVSHTYLPERKAFLSVPGQHPHFYTATSNSNGEVSFFTKNLLRTHELIAQTDSRTDSLAEIEIYQPYSENYADRSVPELNLREDTVALLAQSIAMQIGNIYHSKPPNGQPAAENRHTPFYVNPDKVYILDDYVRFTTMEEVLREYVPEVLISSKKDAYHMRIYNTEAGTFHDSTPLILIDGIPLFDEGNAITRIDPLKIQRLEIVANSYLYGRNIFSGIASFFSYNGDLANYQLPKKAFVMDFSGFQQKREFYSPMYNGDSSTFIRTPDYRTTLFWSADQRTDEQGKSELSFFTSDMDGKYTVDVQALSDDGKAGSAKFTINITK
ncbi:TonB-dependent receptor plug domain-containing protein [Pararcticibacter amylolyticus]|uniref:TonB-dependent receptor plug domain-containing protein n=1 Tax=Pararcticibacter amylolyticus TaxID=2173175 RepID=A0A2U2PIS9_9SPHI|nr:TonB-dependent receptor plug domain-containing protein [Pararcticibacter amylolyticus]PWG81316.1 hypothetical protein DDR33_08065 [Pararcticibacter amylolyticus]